MEKQEAIPLGASRVDAAAVVLARAFQDDELQRYVVPDAGRRARLAPWSFGALIRYCLPHGGVYTTPDLGGVACWMPPGVGLTSPWNLVRSGMILAPLRLGPASFVRFARVTGLMDGERKRSAPARHWYLSCIGVDPSRQGAGIGGSLLRPAFELADREGVPCYLEAQTESNVRFYEGHGFVVTDKLEPPEPPGLRVWTMLRPPR